MKQNNNKRQPQIRIKTSSAQIECTVFLHTALWVCWPWWVSGEWVCVRPREREQKNESKKTLRTVARTVSQRGETLWVSSFASPHTSSSSCVSCNRCSSRQLKYFPNRRNLTRSHISQPESVLLIQKANQITVCSKSKLSAINKTTHHTQYSL